MVLVPDENKGFKGTEEQKGVKVSENAKNLRFQKKTRGAGCFRKIQGVLGDRKDSWYSECQKILDLEDNLGTCNRHFSKNKRGSIKTNMSKIGVMPFEINPSTEV